MAWYDNPLGTIADLIYNAVMIIISPFLNIFHSILNFFTDIYNAFITLYNSLWGLEATIQRVITEGLLAYLDNLWMSIIITGFILVIIFRIYSLIPGLGKK